MLGTNELRVNLEEREAEAVEPSLLTCREGDDRAPCWRSYGDRCVCGLAGSSLTSRQRDQENWEGSGGGSHTWSSRSRCSWWVPPNGSRLSCGRLARPRI